jgi:hypothetical protein
MKTPALTPHLDSPWRAPYWKPAVHGVAWDHVRSSISTDWVQPKIDPTQKAVHDGTLWAAAEPGYRYGFGAQMQYGSQYAKWSDELERKLGSEWNEDQTGQTFASVAPFVRQGFESKR